MAVRAGQIESRRLVTDQAIVEAVTDQKPKTVLDLGCGEGWLARKLAARGIDVLGVDVVPELIEQAKAIPGGQFKVMSYEEIALGKLHRRFDVVVSNFSLLGHTSVERIFQAMPSLLNPQGCFMVQTVHPIVGCGDFPYQNGWREESWAGFSEEFSDPAPWYFRTLASWVQLYRKYGFSLQEIREPLHPLHSKPASIIFSGSLIN